ncbi:molybdopterin-guanine dinucleotide biosynthesis protein B [Cohnella mopanensis]|uniref:molybdopterin-guanine dinucleotide biosynthesis protein B n=1 Tax=Cohnella mopanensis TaxID=2911966 RepID=UPI001EF7D1DA|nr:molybdopterin-guanine dinucleotide biosynthesis protein B [Cohnella mopanensis]
MQIVQIVGYKNAGKTTLTCAFVREFSAQGIRVGTLKHDAHTFEPDLPGKDTWQHRQAGAHITGITSPSRTAWVQEQSTPIERLVAGMEAESVQFLVIEGFKQASYPKVVLLRSEEDANLFSLPNVIAAAIREPNRAIEDIAITKSVPLFVQPDVTSFTPLITYVQRVTL